MEKYNNLKLPVELLLSIAEYTNIYTSSKFFTSSKAMKNIGENYLLSRSDHPFYFLKQNANKIIQASIRGIEKYLKHDKKHPGYSGGGAINGMDEYLTYDRGFHRAICFNDVLKASYKKNVIYELFTVYILLSEKNG